MPLPYGLVKHALGIGLNRVVERQEDVAALARRRRADHVDRAAERVLDDRLGPRPPGEHAVEPELEPRQAAVVDSRVAQHLGRHSALRIGSPLFGIEAETGQVALLERRSLHRVGLALDVDEAARALRQERIERIRAQAEGLSRSEGDCARVPDLVRVGIDRRRLLADRELHAHPVEDRSAPCGNLHYLAVLARRHAPEVLRPDRLEPGRAGQRHAECECEEDEQEAEAAVGEPPAHRTIT